MRLIRLGAPALLAAGLWMALGPSQAFGQKKQRDLIVREEIESSPKRSGSIHDVIRSLRSHFLEAPRGVRRSSIDGSTNRLPGAASARSGLGDGGSSETEVGVFVDRNRLGGIDFLKSVQAEEVEEVRYLDPSKAQADYGMKLGAGGAIVIKYVGKPPTKPAAPQ